MNQNVNAGRDRTVSARTVCPQLQSEGYYGGVAVHKPLITQMSAHLRLQWCKETQVMVCRDVEGRKSDYSR